MQQWGRKDISTFFIPLQDCFYFENDEEEDANSIALQQHCYEDEDHDEEVVDDDKCLAMQLTTYKCQAVQLHDSKNFDDDDDDGDEMMLNMVNNDSFGTAANLRNHLLTHTGEKQHKCMQCHYSTNRAFHLKSHVMKHAGEKSHHCNQCN